MTDDYGPSYAPESEREDRPSTPRPPIIRIMNRDEDEDGVPDARTIEMLAMVERGELWRERRAHSANDSAN